MTSTREHRTQPETASVAETLRVALEVALPTLAGGVIKRRPAALATAGKLQSDRPAIRLLRRLRDRHHGHPLKLRVPGRSVELALSGADVKRVLAGAPTPFSPSTVEKRAALGHFQPHGVLISDAADRPARRRFTEAVLQPGRPLHELAGPFAKAVEEETAVLLDSVTRELDWDTFTMAWWRLVRRVVLGSGARDDTTLTDQLARLRLDANWAYLHPKRRQLREQFRRRLTGHLDRAEPGSLAAAIAAAGPEGKDTAPDQVAHWLFAFDAAGMATFRTLALLAGHPAAADRAREDLEDTGPARLSYLRACVLDAVRLWPTTPMLLRETTEETSWGPAGTTVLIFTPFFHRDPDLPYADRFEPDLWLDGRAAENPALVPFSAGPAICPGRDLVRFCASTMLANLLREHRFEQTAGPVLSPDRPLPATLDHFHLRVRLLPVTPEP